MEQMQRFSLFFLGIVSLLLALWGGLVRLGWQLPSLEKFPFLHGPLMVCGFLGTVIGLERAVVAQRLWAYLFPFCTGLGSLLLFWSEVGKWLILGGSLGVVVLLFLFLKKHLAVFSFTMTVGAVLWNIGNLLWLCQYPLFYVVPWWMGFLLFTIAGERLEMSRVLSPPGYSQWLFGGISTVYVLGAFFSLFHWSFGLSLVGVAMFLFALWLLRYDVVKRTIKQKGIARFTALCLLLGYFWLALAGGMAFFVSKDFSLYDGFLHSVFLGFVFSMIFGHAPIILPTVMGGKIVFHPFLYFPLVLLHLFLLLRIFGGFFSSSLVLLGGMGNAVAILLFFFFLFFLKDRDFFKVP